MSIYRTLFVLLLALGVSETHAQDYQVSLIPDSLKTNAHSVIRAYNVEMELKSYNAGSEKITKAITILDKEGESIGYLAIPYDKNTNVSIKQIVLFDSNGKKVKSIKQSEITDSPEFNSSELFSESRIKYYKPLNSQYPYTVMYEYELDMKNIISLGCWMPLSNYNLSVQQSKLTFSHPARVKINKKEINIQEKSSELHNDIIVDSWEINNMTALESEPYSTSLSERVPCLYLMPSRLIYDKYEGNADNWLDYGLWMYSLYQNRDNISDAERIKIESLLKEIPDTLGRIRALYKYMQNNTRYVAITLGLGGFQPFDANTVAGTGYGDCKALTNYMYSLLKMNNIKSYPALVSSGRYKESIFGDFPNFQQFDHVILCVPHAGDTIWLECTNQQIPFGFLGDFTDGREVLLITETGGKFAHTSNYRKEDNTRSCRSEIKIDSDGSASCSILTTYKGLQFDGISEFLNSGYDEQKKWLYSNSSLPSLQINSFSVTDFKHEKPEARVSESELSKNFCSFSGSYMVLPLNLINAQRPIGKMLKQRHSDIVINRSATDYDTLVYSIPENYRFETLPSGTSINSKFGSYSSSVTSSDKGIIFTRKYVLLEGHYKPSLYKELYDFVLLVSKADNIKVLLTKKT